PNRKRNQRRNRASQTTLTRARRWLRERAATVARSPLFARPVVPPNAATLTPMREFRTTDVYSPTGDQPRAIAEIASSIADRNRFQTILGATGTGKTATMAWIIEKVQKPALVIAHNKTLAAQLCNEFREFFPEN